MKTAGSILVLFVFVSATIAMAQEDSMKGPWRRPDTKGVRHGSPKHGLNPLVFLVRAYRRYISPIDGSRCPMYPSCSTYSLECFEKHGFFVGWMMTCNRLYRCGRDELRLSPWVIINGVRKCYDPVKNNDFWWSDGK